MKKTSIQFLTIILFLMFTASVSFSGSLSTILGKLSQDLYLGGALGYDYAKINDQFLFDFTTSHGPSTQVGYDYLAAGGFFGGGFIGYGKKWGNHLYLGVELLANGSSASVTNQTIYNHTHEELFDGDGYSNTISIKNNVGISLLPGVEVNNTTLVYGRLGYSKARITGTEGVVFYSEPSGLPQKTTQYTLSYSPNGFSYGLGIETAPIKHFSLRVELIHTDYQFFTTSLDNRISVSDNQAALSFLYHF